MIIGGATAGSAVAWFLSANPDFDGSVLVVERDPSWSRSATIASNNCMRQQFATEINVTIAQYAAEFVRNFRENLGGSPDIPDIPIRNFGYLYLADNEDFADILRRDQALQATVQMLHQRGIRVICYLSAGTWEPYRPDSASFSQELMGGPVAGWPDERWLDIRRLDALRPLMAARLDLCRDKAFDGVEPDWLDNHTQDTGFPLTAADQLRFNRMLADLAHERGLAIGLKNDLGQADELAGLFDFSVVEQCRVR